MNYNELFRITEKDDCCIIEEYLEKRNKNVTSVEIPETYNGKPITVIGEEAFRDAVYMERITFPDSVALIEWQAFCGCSSLHDIVWANGLTRIGSNAFKECTALERLELPEGLVTINNYAFGKCASLKEVILPRSLDMLDAYAFENCGLLEKVTFLHKSMLVGNFAFKGCPKLPAETLMYPLILSCNPDKPFVWYSTDHYFDAEFDWDTALREDVFALAVEHNSFGNVNKKELFATLFHRHLMDGYFPYMKKNGWIYREKQIKALAETLCYYLGGRYLLTLENSEWFADVFPKLSDSLLDELTEAGDVELTAWLLDYKNRRFGFDTEDKYEL